MENLVILNSYWDERSASWQVSWARSLMETLQSELLHLWNYVIKIWYKILNYCSMKWKCYGILSSYYKMVYNTWPTKSPSCWPVSWLMSHHPVPDFGRTPDLTNSCPNLALRFSLRQHFERDFSRFKRSNILHVWALKSMSVFVPCLLPPILCLSISTFHLNYFVLDFQSFYNIIPADWGR